MKRYLLIRNELKGMDSGKDPSVLVISQLLTNEIEAIWENASVPTVSSNRIIRLIRDILKKVGDKLHRKIKTEEHISLLEEPGFKYLNHITPTSVTGRHIATSILNFFEESGIGTGNLLVVGCDGTAVNTGRKNGVLLFLKIELKRSLQWSICLLHMNELPLRHIFQYIDGKTSGPRKYSGNIGKLLESCENLPVIHFVPIHTTLPQLDAAVIRDLSSDQKYLYEIYQLVSNGKCSIDLATRNLCKLSHARWVTKANRILRVYVRSENPSLVLRSLAQFVVKVYEPVWFNIKAKISCSEEARHVFKMIQLSRYLSNDLKAVIEPVIKRISYFCHSENLLLAVLSDDRPAIRQLALRKMLKTHTKIPTLNTNEREFLNSDLNFNASEYYKLINSQNCSVTMPPLLCATTDEDIRKCINVEEIFPTNFFLNLEKIKVSQISKK
ncbi:unnamed protein product [Diabrotica balteata]|uniref:Uncharacterized protein n=1 Tax=Diabrotica balteata TaxID=107213 RepID=A0A9N9SQ19_DIABA|nr:unnamed protein product [Diabrotica balteata]